MNVESLIGQDGIDCCQRSLNSLQARNPDIRFVLLATTDGFEVAASGAIDTEDYSRMAAMASSIISLSQAIVQGTGLPSCEDVLVNGVAGKILVMAVPGRPPEMILMAVSHANAASGALMFELRTTGMEIRRALTALDIKDSDASDDYLSVRA